MAVVGCSNSSANKYIEPETPKTAANALPPTVATSASQWDISKETNDLDHKSKIVLSHAGVYLRCAPKFEGYITPEIPSLGHSLDSDSDHMQAVRYRIDNSPIKQQRWNISSDFEALFIPTTTLRAALKGKKLVVEFRPSYVMPQTQTFTIDGLAEAARNAGCKL